MNCPFCGSLPETMGKYGPDQPTRCSDTANYCIASFDWTPRSRWETRISQQRKSPNYAALWLVAVVLVMYGIIDLYVDRQSEHELRDLQRRVGQLEQGR